MSPHLQTVADTFATSRDRLHALVEATDAEAFNRKPSVKGWSAGECVVHLNKTAKAYLSEMDALITPDAPRGAGPYEWGWMSRRFIEAVRPGSRPLPTGGGMKPPRSEGLRSAVDRERAVARFDADTDHWLALCERAEGIDLSRIKMRSPFLPILRLPVGVFLEAMGLHALRHVGQAERAVQA